MCGKEWRGGEVAHKLPQFERGCVEETHLSLESIGFALVWSRLLEEFCDGMPADGRGLG